VTSPSSAMSVQLFDNSWGLVRKVSDYLSCSVTWQRLGVGSGTLVVSETDPAAPLLLAVDSTVVPVRVQVAGQSWPGRVVSSTLDLSQPPGGRTVTATLVDEWTWLQAMLASQNGGNPSLVGMPQYDKQTGAAATVAAYYINAAATRLGVPVAASPPAVDDSPQVTLNARMQTLADLLTNPLEAAGLVMPVSLWLPGDAQPYGLVASLTRPTLVFWPQAVPAKPWLRWSDTVGGITGGSLTVSAPTAFRQVLGLQGEDADRAYDVYVDTGLQASLGAYALPEAYTDATDIAAAGAESQARGEQKQVDDAGTVSAAVTVEDGAPWRFGTDYGVGDIATLKVAGVGFQEPITRVTATDNRDGGLVFTPQIGDPTSSATSDELIVQAMASIALQLRAVQTGR
jgi:Siphovirus ReqiPepy6 Gp37-like protein